jgi:CheY-like chemotaxis protein
MSSPTILIADDDADLVRALAARCRHLGLSVVTAHDGFTALSRAHSARPQLVCLDVNMPSGNGLSVCEMIGSDAQFKNIPKIILTGNIDMETIQRCHSLCAYYVPKCVDVWSRVGPLIRELMDLDDEQVQPDHQGET